MLKFISLSLFLGTSLFAKDLPPQLAIGSLAPEIKVVNTNDGKYILLTDYQGKGNGVCVIFSCNHCPVAQAYEDRMIALGNEFQKQGVQFVLISSNDTADYPQDGPSPMRERALAKKYPFPYAFDPTQHAGRSFGARVTPHVFLLDKDLKLVYRGAIDDSQDPSKVQIHYLSNALNALVSGKIAIFENTETEAKGCSIKWRE